MQKISPSEFDIRTVLQAAVCYIDWAIPVQNFWNDVHNNRLITLLKASSCISHYFFCAITLCVLVDTYRLGWKCHSMDTHSAGYCQTFHRYQSPPTTIHDVISQKTNADKTTNTASFYRSNMCQILSLSVLGPRLGNLEGGSSTGDFENWMNGALAMVHPSPMRLHEGGLVGGPSLGTLEDTLGKSPDAGCCLHGGALSIRCEPGSGGGCSYTGDNDRWMKEGSSGGASLCEGFHEGDFEGGLRYWGARKMMFLRDMQNAL